MALSRLVVSGASFTDETARDAQRGILFSGASAGQVIRALFPESGLLAYCEDGHPNVTPDSADFENYTVNQIGGRLQDWRVRWNLPCSEASAVDSGLDAGANVILVLEQPPTAPLPESIRELLFLLT
ncbi:MAG: hypothetical protein QGG40_01295, partial [Myxococcota bacterium]|nr:hypothetical protein [Myxococcota bacterium]